MRVENNAVAVPKDKYLNDGIRVSYQDIEYINDKIQAAEKQKLELVYAKNHNLVESSVDVEKKILCADTVKSHVSHVPSKEDTNVKKYAVSDVSTNRDEYRTIAMLYQQIISMILLLMLSMKDMVRESNQIKAEMYKVFMDSLEIKIATQLEAIEKMKAAATKNYVGSIIRNVTSILGSALEFGVATATLRGNLNNYHEQSAQVQEIPNQLHGIGADVKSVESIKNALNNQAGSLNERLKSGNISEEQYKLVEKKFESISKMDGMLSLDEIKTLTMPEALSYSKKLTDGKQSFISEMKDALQVVKNEGVLNDKQAVLVKYAMEHQAFFGTEAVRNQDGKEIGVKFTSTVKDGNGVDVANPLAQYEQQLTEVKSRLDFFGSKMKSQEIHDNFWNTTARTLSTSIQACGSWADSSFNHQATYQNAEKEGLNNEAEKRSSMTSKTVDIMDKSEDSILQFINERLTGLRDELRQILAKLSTFYSRN